MGRAATTLLYAPSPQHANPLATRDRGKVHGPQVGNELWLHHDGSPGELEGWARPFAGERLLAPAECASVGCLFNLPPIPWEGWLVWPAAVGSGWIGLQAGRIAGLTSRTNAEFSTPLMRLPNRALRLDAEVLWPGSRCGWGYINCQVSSSGQQRSFSRARDADPLVCPAGVRDG